MINNKNIFSICFVLLLITISFDFIMGIHLAWYLFPITFLFFAIVLGSFNLSYNFFLKTFSGKSDLSEKKVSLTFDDGPHPEYTPQVLQILKKYGAVATFFCIGKNISTSSDLVKQIYAEGHSVGNHSYSHNNFIDFYSKEKWIEEIGQTDILIEAATGRKCRLFRPPFGVTTPNLANALQTTGHTVIGWNIRTFDTIVKNPDLILKKISDSLKPGSIILLHDTHDKIPVILEQLLKMLHHKNYKSITIEDLL